MASAVDTAKRALVRVLRHFAVLYNVAFNVTRDSADEDVRQAYRGCRGRAQRRRACAAKCRTPKVTLKPRYAVTKVRRICNKGAATPSPP